MSPKVLCLRPEADFVRAAATAPSTLSVDYRAPDAADVPALMKSADALLIPAVGPPLAPSLFDATRLKLVQITGAGVDRLDRARLTALDIPVANVAGGSNAAVAEYAVTNAALLLRRFAWSSSEIRRGRYAEFRARLLSDNVGGLEGLTAGIVGFGTIGIAVARAFHARGCRIVFFDPAPGSPRAAEELEAEQVSLPELLARAEIVTLHVPLLPGTRNLIGAAELKSMKPGAVLIHAARGEIVDEAALAASLISGHLGGAAIDVYSAEPPDPDNPLLTLSGEAAERTVLTPHIAGVTRQASTFLFRSAWDNVERVLVRGEPPLNRVH